MSLITLTTTIGNFTRTFSFTEDSVQWGAIMKIMNDKAKYSISVLELKINNDFISRDEINQSW